MPSNRYGNAFSLVELLVVVAVIAIIAAIAIPGIFHVGDQANYAKNRRNAQTVASVAGAAKAAGAVEDLSGTNAVFLLQPPGVTARWSGGGDLSFSVSTMSLSEQADAARYLSNSLDTNFAVIYVPD